MSKILAATCDASGKVTADGVVVPEAVVLSLGKQASSGLLYLDGEKAWYFPSSATDIEATLGQISQAIEKIANVLTAIGGGMTGPTTAPPPTLATDVAAIMQIKAAVDQLKGALK